MSIRIRLIVISALVAACALFAAGTAPADTPGSPDQGFGGNPAPGMSAARMPFMGLHAAGAFGKVYVIGGNDLEGNGHAFGVVPFSTEGLYESFGPSLKGMASVSIENGEPSTITEDEESSDTVVGGSGAPAPGPEHDFALAGFIAPDFEDNGALDTTFGGENGAAKGTEFTSFGHPAGIDALTTDENGNIIAAGHVEHGTNGMGEPVEAIALARYNDHGKLDTSFGGKNGDAPGTTVTVLANSGAPNIVRIEPGTGKILVAGWECAYNCESIQSRSEILVARYTSSGVLDTSFGPHKDGTTTVEIKNRSNETTDTGAQGFVFEEDGDIVVVGDATVSECNEIILTQLDSSGIETNFAATGTAFATASYPDASLYASGIVKQGDGKLVATGTYQPSNGEPGRLLVLRFNPDGSFDTTFGSGGGVVTAFKPSSGETSTEASALNPLLDEGIEDIVLPARLSETTAGGEASGYVGVAAFRENGTCPSGDTGAYPNCVAQTPPQCPTGDTGTYPNCIAPPPPDTTPPVISLEGNIDTAYDANGGSVVAQEDKTRFVKYSCTDNEPGGSGTEVSCSATISLKGSKPSPYASGGELSTWGTGAGQISIEATDKAGKRSEADVHYRVETKDETVCNPESTLYNNGACLGITSAAPGLAEGALAASLIELYDAPCPAAADACAWDAEHHLVAEEYKRSDGSAEVKPVGLGRVIKRSDGSAIIAVGSGSLISDKSVGIIAVGSGSIIAVGSGSFSGLLSAGGLMSTSIAGFSPGSMYASANGVIAVGSGTSGFMSGFKATFARHTKHKKKKQPRLVPLISGAATVTQSGGTAVLVLRYTARGRSVITTLVKENANLIKRHKKPHSLKLDVVLKFTPKSGKPTTVSKMITVTPRPATTSKPHGKHGKHNKHHK